MSEDIDWPDFVKTLNKRGMKLREGNPDVMAAFRSPRPGLVQARRPRPQDQGTDLPGHRHRRQVRRLPCLPRQGGDQVRRHPRGSARNDRRRRLHGRRTVDHLRRRGARRLRRPVGRLSLRSDGRLRPAATPDLLAPCRPGAGKKAPPMFEIIAELKDLSEARILVAALRAHGFHPLEGGEAGLPGLPGVRGLGGNCRSSCPGAKPRTLVCSPVRCSADMRRRAWTGRAGACRAGLRGRAGAGPHRRPAQTRHIGGA